MREAIPVFDLGNVIVRVDFSPALDWLSARSTKYSSQELRTLLPRSRAYDSYERGELSTEKFAAAFAIELRAEFDFAEFCRVYCEIMPGLVPGMEEVIDALVARGPVYVLSNTCPLHMEYAQKRFPIYQKFTKAFTSYELRARKPELAIFESLRSELDVSADQLVFFDDLSENVSGAQAAGWNAHLFEDAGQVQRIFREI